MDPTSTNVNNPYANNADAIQRVINNTTVGNTSQTKNQVVVLAGRGSKGKSTIATQLIGHDVTFYAAGESTKMIIEYYVHWITATESPSFYIHATDDSDPSKKVNSAQEMRQFVIDENQALQNSDATR